MKCKTVESWKILNHSMLSSHQKSRTREKLQSSLQFLVFFCTKSPPVMLFVFWGARRKAATKSPLKWRNALDGRRETRKNKGNDSLRLTLWYRPLWFSYWPFRLLHAAINYKDVAGVSGVGWKRLFLFCFVAFYEKKVPTMKPTAVRAGKICLIMQGMIFFFSLAQCLLEPCSL